MWVLMFIGGCDAINPDDLECRAPKPLQPSFTQSKYTVHVGEAVTFTYNGPTQPAGVSLSWQVYAPSGTKFTGNGETFTLQLDEVGQYSVRLGAVNCNPDVPQMYITPCVTVTP